MQLTSQEHASLVPHLTKYFIVRQHLSCMQPRTLLDCLQPATSLGGVESLIEQRASSDSSADPRLIRLSIGVEDVEDLKDDLRQAFQAVLKNDNRKV